MVLWLTLKWDTNLLAFFNGGLTTNTSPLTDPCTKSHVHYTGKPQNSLTSER